VSFHRLLPLLALVALLLAPFGRAAAAEAMAMPDTIAAAMAGHCNDGPEPADHRSDGAAVDCLIACGVMTPAAGPALVAEPPLRLVPATSPLPAISGLHPEADPPPPRFS
jgi:hypothetical protein